jgi:hypothetical protein
MSSVVNNGDNLEQNYYQLGDLMKQRVAKKCCGKCHVKEH